MLFPAQLNNYIFIVLKGSYPITEGFKSMDDKHRKPPPIYRTDVQAETELLEIKDLFNRISTPSIKCRPMHIWEHLKKHNILDNIKPVVNALQANRYVI